MSSRIGLLTGALALLVAAPASAQTATLVRMVDTSQYSPPSPDSAGIAYLPSVDQLLISDSEVNEMPLFAGANLFRTTREGSLLGTGVTTAWSNEPTGVTFNPNNGHIFTSDDDWDEVYEIDPGPDGLHGTPDDTFSIIHVDLFGSFDPEGIAYNTALGVLHIVDGANALVYTLDPGPNGVFDGVSPEGDDTQTSFNTASLGVSDPEGIAYHEGSGQLYIVGFPETIVVHCTSSGSWLRTIDISAAAPYIPAGMTFAPSSVTGSGSNLYIVDRGADNNWDPNENDGRMYEMFLPPLNTVNTAPTVDAGSNLTVGYPGSAQLQGSITDDGLPTPPGFVTASWSVVSGPGSVSFSNPNSAVTSATPSVVGTYVLRLSADDGEFVVTDDVEVVSAVAAQTVTLDIRVVTGNDDAEQRANGSLYRTSSDLELVFDHGSNQDVGMRFLSVGIPQGATIQEAWIQFTADEPSSVATSLTFEGQDSDNAVTFSNSADVVSRPRTAAAVGWAPFAWTAGSAGPNQRTPDLASLIQEIVDRPGWVAGNALAILVSGTGERVAESYNGDANAAPLLHIVFESTSAAPSVDAGPDIFASIGVSELLDATVLPGAGSQSGPGELITNWTMASGPGSVTFADPTAVDTLATFSTAGTYSLRLTAWDGPLSSHDELLATVTGTGGTTILDVRVEASGDDVEERSWGKVLANSSDLELTTDGQWGQTVAMRFNGLAIPQGAVIQYAYVQFQADETDSGASALFIEGHDVDSSPPIGTDNYSVTSLPRTSASVSWAPPAWTTVGAAGPDQRTPNLAAVLQEIINRPGWGPGNSITIVISGSGERTAESQNGSSSGAPLLHIEYQ